MKTLKWVPLMALVLSLAGCQTTPQQQVDTAGLVTPTSGTDFNGYWYAGQAELNAYKLEQARYGERHPGHAILVFVTEPFLTDKQVKSDRSQAPTATSVMKMNALRKFPTGVYDYSIMTSVFTPIERKQYPHTLKVTGSSQEWCGHTFAQLNLKGDEYVVKGFSYFESEGDEEFPVPVHVLEDELFNLIRLEPNSLPTGTITLIPGLTFSRLRHRPVQPEKANANIVAYTGNDFKGNDPMLYTVDFPGSKRKLAICYEKEFPRKILGWEEEWTSGWGPSAQPLTTRAVLTKQIKSDYWNRNGLSDMKLRKELGLP